MQIRDVYPEFEVERSDSRCTRCRLCEAQCANGVHRYDAQHHVMLADDSRCVNCQRCVSVCPARALKIVESGCTLRKNANWDGDTVREIYKQSASGGVLLSSMGNPKPMPIYWDKLLLNASQVTNPSIDPLRRAHGDPGVSGEKAQPDQAGRPGPAGLHSAAPAGAEHAGAVFRHELRLHQL